jgi:hypothetical protein
MAFFSAALPVVRPSPPVTAPVFVPFDVSSAAARFKADVDAVTVTSTTREPAKVTLLSGSGMMARSARCSGLLIVFDRDSEMSHARGAGKVSDSFLTSIAHTHVHAHER